MANLGINAQRNLFDSDDDFDLEQPDEGEPNGDLLRDDPVDDNETEAVVRQSRDNYGRTVQKMYFERNT